MGLELAHRPIQKDSMDDTLRNCLWNEFDMLFLQDLRESWKYSGYNESRNPPNAALFVRLWRDFYKSPLTTLPQFAVQAATIVHQWYFNTNAAPWNRVYDFVEFTGDLCGNLEDNASFFRIACNLTLEREASAYRFVGKIISPITSEAEIKTVEQAMSADNSVLSPVNQHIETALKRLSDRNNPDYRNSMKESISAVEALCKIIAKNDKSTLGPALDVIRAKIQMHPKLQEGFKALYGYTSDDHGIRHALKDDGQPEPEDARYFLVSCSAFVNLLTEKARKLGPLS
jgi:hypothetical protein